MAEPLPDPARYRKPLPAAMLEAMRTHGASHIVAEDASGRMSYRQLFTRAFILSEKLALPPQEKYVAMMLPNALGAVVTFVALHMLGRVPCMLNFTAGEANVLHGCRIAGVRTVLTSRLFVARAKLESLAAALERDFHVVYLEDFRKSVGFADKLKGLFKALLPAAALKSALAMQRPADPAVILYTSGSEGRPKGVALSHANILANIAQACLRLELTPRDTVFNAMPVFHSFGLTVGMLLPLALGLRTYLYPSPVHFKQIPPLVESSGATIMLGTDTFYNGYARHAERHHFARIRLAVAGAERLREPTRLLWRDTLGVDIMQGYGVTETSPAVSINTANDHRPGTVGRLFPGMEAKLEKVEGLNEGGRLLLKGPNVMLGYLDPDRPGDIKPQGDWYDTGDIVTLDADGFITIKGRAKRFAKIAGEMISLVAVEELALSLFPEAGHAAIAIPEERRGEQILLFTEAAGLTRDVLLKAAKEKGVAEICLPKDIRIVAEIPRLGSGKIDYQAVQRLL